MTPPVALEAKSTHVAQVTFTTAFDNGHDVIRVPKRFAAFQTPRHRGFQARAATQPAKVSIFGHAVNAANRADSFVAFEDTLA
jgi:threonine dehydrogenase-like Zn-dependent dehydrogenase